MSIFGTCKLCQSPGVELRDSHLLPKAGYRAITKSQGGDAPILMNSEIAIRKDEQVRGHVFCGDCEERFNKNGERWVMKNCYRVGEGFALKAALDGAVPERDEGNRLKVYSTTNLPEIDVPKLVYFAASVFWRASVHNWKSGGRTLTLPKLGRKYEEQFRQYLLDSGNLPENATLVLSVITEEKLWNYFTFPYGDKENDYWRSQFPFLGLSFTLLLGNLVPREIRRFCLAHSAKQYITMCKAADDMVLIHLGKLQAKSKPVSSLTKVTWQRQ